MTQKKKPFRTPRSSSWLCYTTIAILAAFARIEAAPTTDATAEAFGSSQNKAPQIIKYHVTSKIQMRYVITGVEAKVANFGDETQEVSLDVVVPEDAFVSRFAMDIKDKTYLAHVEETKKAEDVFKASGTTSGLVQSSASKSVFQDDNVKTVKFSVKVEGQSKATFHLRYEQQLQREGKGGKNRYHHDLYLPAKLMASTDFRIQVALNETMPLQDVAVKVQESPNEIVQNSPEITDEVVQFDLENKNALDILYEGHKLSGKEWKLVTFYDLKRESDNEVQIGAGKFVHYFSPESFPSLPKHIIFVIDVSGSMNGRKMEQTKDALVTMFQKMEDRKIDSFNIILFEDSVKIWSGRPQVPGELAYNITQQEDGVKPARDFVLHKVNAGGGTNINDALLEAIKLAQEVKKNEEITSGTPQMIVFLTDGEPTSGQTDRNVIKDNVKEANANSRIPIYSLAFGNGADFDLIKDISNENDGFAQRIYESGNSFEQIEDFYNQISDPKLKNVKFDYLLNGKRIDPLSLTTKDVPQAFGSNEYLVVGEFHEEFEEISIILTGENEFGPIQKEINFHHCLTPRALPSGSSEEEVISQTFLDKRCIPTLPAPPQWEMSSQEEFMSRLWAFKRINYLISEENCTMGIDETFETTIQPLEDTTILPNETTIEYEDFEEENEECQKEAIRLAKKFNFVTKVTSMVVETSDEYSLDISIDSKKPLNDGFVGGFMPYMTMRNAAPPSYSAPVLRRGRPTPTSFQQSYLMNTNFMMKTRLNVVPRRPTSGIFSQYDSDVDDYDNFSDYGYYGGHTTTITSRTSTLPPPPGSCKLIMFSQTYFRGESKEIDQDHTDFAQIDFDDKLGSLKIEGNCCWNIASDANFGGQVMQLRKGEYKSATQIADIFKQASSARAYTTC